MYNTLSELRILEVSRPNGSVECWSVLCALEILHICQSSLIASDHSQYLDLCSLYTAGLWALASEKVRYYEDYTMTLFKLYYEMLDV